MGTIASQITSLTIVYSTVYHCLLNRLFERRSRKHQSSASLAFVWGIHLGSPHKWPVMRKCFQLMTSSCEVSTQYWYKPDQLLKTENQIIRCNDVKSASWRPTPPIIWPVCSKASLFNRENNKVPINGPYWEGNPPRVPSQRIGNAESVSMSWSRHVIRFLEWKLL